MITFAVTYYNQRDMLLRQLHLWQSFSKDLKRCFDFFIMDDGSREENSALGCVQEVDPNLNLTVLRALEDKAWNNTGGRNLIMKESPNSLVVLNDVDHLFRHNIMRDIMTFSHIKNVWWVFSRRIDGGGHCNRGPNIIMVDKDEFWRIGGYNEKFAGRYGMDDREFIRRAKRGGIKFCQIRSRHHIYVVLAAGAQGLPRDTKHNDRLCSKLLAKRVVPKEYILFEWDKVMGVKYDG